MPDRDNVIKEFEHLLNAAKGNYQDFVDLTVDGGDDILAMLKEQEAIPVDTNVIGAFNGDVEVYCCRNCRLVLDLKYHYCPNCGRQIKWNA